MTFENYSYRGYLNGVVINTDMDSLYHTEVKSYTEFVDNQAKNTKLVMSLFGTGDIYYLVTWNKLVWDDTVLTYVVNKDPVVEQVTKSQAAAWLSIHNPHRGLFISDDTVVAKTVRLRKSFADKLEFLAKQRNISFTRLVSDALEKQLSFRNENKLSLPRWDFFKVDDNYLLDRSYDVIYQSSDFNKELAMLAFNLVRAYQYNESAFASFIVTTINDLESKDKEKLTYFNNWLAAFYVK